MPAHFSGRTASTSRLAPVALVGLVIAVLSALLTTVPAQGAVPVAARVTTAGETGDAVTLTTHDVAGYNVPCFQATVVVTQHFDASTAPTWSGRWSALAQVEDPGGELHNRSYDGIAGSQPLSFQLCSEYGLAGTYRVNVSWNQYDANGDSIAQGDTFGSFVYTLKPRSASRLSVAKKPYGRTGWTFTGRLDRVGKPYARQGVQIWIRWRGSWTNFEETKRTNDRGRVSWHTKSRLRKNTYVFQLRYPGNVTTKPARSTTFRLQGR